MNFLQPSSPFLPPIFQFWRYYYDEEVLLMSQTALPKLIEVTACFTNEFQSIGLEVLPSLLTFLELMLSWISFAIKDYADMDGITIEAMNQLHDNIESVKTKLLNANIFSDDEEQIHRIESHFQDIFEAVKHCVQRRQEEGVATMDEADKSPEMWQPFFKYQHRFGTENERLFVTRLRRLYLTIDFVGGTEIIQELVNICESTPSYRLQFNRDTSRDTAMRCIKVLLIKVTQQILNGQGSEVEMSQDRHTFLETYWRSMNSGTLLGNDPVIHSTRYIYRLRSIALAMRVIYNNLDISVEDEQTSPALEQEPNPGSPTVSVLWQKLGAPESLTDIIENTENRSCSICLLVEDVTSLNFAIIDKCPHLFCYNCIKEWFKRKSTCPYCRTQVSAWTTRDFALAFLDQNQQS